MKYLIISLLALFSSLSLLAQSSIPELEEKYKTAKPGFDQVDYLLGIAQLHYFQGNPEGMKQKIEEAKRISTDLNDPLCLGYTSYFEYTYAIMFEGNPEAVERLSSEAESYAAKTDDPNLKALAAIARSQYIHLYKDDAKTALELLLPFGNNADKRFTSNTLGQVHQSISFLMKGVGKPDEGFDHLEKSLELLKTVEAQTEKHHLLNRVSALDADKGLNNKVETYAQLSTHYIKTEQKEKGKEYLLMAYDLIKDSGYLDSYAFIGRKLGEYYELTGSPEIAISYFEESITLLDSLGMEKDVNYLNYLITRLSFNLEDFEGALKSALKTGDFYKEIKDTMGIVALGEFEVRCYNNLKRYEEGLSGAQKYGALAKQLGSVHFYNWFLLHEGEAEFRLGNYEPALKKVRTFLRYMNANKMEEESRVGYGILSDVFLQLNEPDSVLFYSNIGKDICGKYSREKGIIAFNNKIYRAHEEKGDYKEALAYLKLYSDKQDSLKNAETQRILRKEQVRQDVEGFKEETAEATLAAQLLKERNRLYLGIAIALLLILALVSYLFNQLRKTKQALEEKNKDLDELNKTKDRFFSIIAHDIRSPIISLEKVGDLVSYYLKKNDMDKLKNLSTEISGTAGRLNSLLDNLLNWALIQQGVLPNRPGKLKLNDVVDETLAMFKVNAQIKEQTIENHLEGDVYIHADEKAIQTILRNLLSNAIKFTDVGGSIKIGASQEGGQIKLYLKDDGVGMEQDKLDKIFKLNPKSEKGTQGERGTGLGLILCKELIELNQGEINVQSKINEGTEFKITLPKAA